MCINNVFYCCFSKNHLSYLLNIRSESINKKLNSPDFLNTYRVEYLKDNQYTERICLENQHNFISVSNPWHKNRECVFPNIELSLKMYSDYMNKLSI